MRLFALELFQGHRSERIATETKDNSGNRQTGLTLLTIEMRKSFDAPEIKDARRGPRDMARFDDVLLKTAKLIFEAHKQAAFSPIHA
jgi:hypothetical protein